MTPGQRAAGNGGIGWLEVTAHNAAVSGLQRAREREGIAVEALEAIAARGILVRFVEPPTKPWMESTTVHRCPGCSTDYVVAGACGNRECSAVIARRALDDMRRAL